MDSVWRPTTVSYVIGNQTVYFTSTIYNTPWADRDGDGIPDSQ